MRQTLSRIALFVLVLPNLCLAEQSVSRGYVTHLSSDNAFDLDGAHVLISKTTPVFNSPKVSGGTIATGIAGPLQLYLGETVEVTGELDRKSNTITAKKIVLSAPPFAQLSGLGIIDALPPALHAESDKTARVVRADGYTLLLPAKANLTFYPPLTSQSPITTNLWIRYEGSQRPDGVVVVDRAGLSINTVEHNEDDLRQKVEYDPSTVDPDDAQSGLSKHLIGLKVKRLPPYKDEAMETRIRRVGSSLIPAFQRELPEKDPTRIDFRLHLVDLPKIKDSIALDSGIILVPYQVVERLPDDSELAAVLADSIAEILEKQDYRGKPTAHKLAAANWAGAAAGVVIPGAGVASAISTHEIAKKVLAQQIQQSGRVSLCLMHDAGYNLAAAPTAWWTLYTKEGKEFTHSKMPDHTVYLYEDLGTTWHPVAP